MESIGFNRVKLLVFGVGIIIFGLILILTGIQFYANGGNTYIPQSPAVGAFFLLAGAALTILAMLGRRRLAPPRK